MGAPPKSVTKMNKDGVTFTSSVDFTSYTLHELTRAALRDVGKYIARESRKKVKRITGRGAKNIQYWVKHKQEVPELEIGVKPGGFYMGFQEIGTKKTPKIGAIYSSVSENIPMIIQIQSQYLSAMNDLESAQSLIDEGEVEGTEDE